MNNDDDEQNIGQRRRRRQQVYMSLSELNAVLRDPFFSDPITVSRVPYFFYRGRKKCTVLTVRFNLVPQFNRQSMERELLALLDNHISTFPNRPVLASVRYDLVLRSSGTDPAASFYIWRANTNQADFDDNDELVFVPNYANLFQFCNNAVNINIPFRNSRTACSLSLANSLAISTKVKLCSSSTSVCKGKNTYCSKLASLPKMGSPLI